ncbi:MAG TPA: site-specific integrase [Methylomirabilota bacterium]|nr:site-specific integrase [Methylomirabilota bacterium]
MRLERELLAARDRGEAPVDERRAPAFEAFAQSWIEEGRSGWKASTLAQYQQILKSQLVPALGAHRVSAITESRIRHVITALHDAGLSARRINLTLLVLKMILRTALRRRYLRDDPTETIRSLREPKAEVDPLDSEEVAGFLAACPAWWRPYFTVACWTGARPNELAALRWGDVDAGRGIVRIRAGRYRGKDGPPKTASSVRDIDLLPPVVDALKAQRAQQAAERLKAGRGAPEPGQDYVFTGPEAGLLNVNALRDRVWYPTLTKAGLRRRIMYQTRHTFASNALAAGEAPSWVAAMLGHTSPEMLFSVYTRYIPNRTRRDGSALLSRMSERTDAEASDLAGSAVLPKYSR